MAHLAFLWFLGTSHLPFIRQLHGGTWLGARDSARIPSWVTDLSPEAKFFPAPVPCPMCLLVFFPGSLDLRGLEPPHVLKGLWCASVELNAGEELMSKKQTKLAPFGATFFTVVKRGIHQKWLKIHVKLHLELRPPRGELHALWGHSGAWQSLCFRASIPQEGEVDVGSQDQGSINQVRVIEMVEIQVGAQHMQMPSGRRRDRLWRQKVSQGRWRTRREGVCSEGWGWEQDALNLAGWEKRVLALCGKCWRAGEWHGHIQALKRWPCWSVTNNTQEVTSCHQTEASTNWAELLFLPYKPSHPMIILALIRRRTRFPISSLMDLLSSSVTTCFLACFQEEHFQPFGDHVEEMSFQRK